MHCSTDPDPGLDPGLDAPTAPEQARARLDRILDLTSDGWWDWDRVSGHRHGSARAWQLLGYAEAPADGGRTRWQQMMHAEDRRPLLRAVAAAVRGGDEQVAVQIRLRHRQGHWVPVLWRGCIERDAGGRLRRLSGTHTDLRELQRRSRERLDRQAGPDDSAPRPATLDAERRQWALRLQQSLALLDNLAQHVPGALYQFQLHPDGRMCMPFASRGLWQVFEVTPEQVRDDASVLFLRIDADDAQAVSDAIAASAATLQPWRQEFRVGLPTQGPRWLRGESQPERLSDGSVLWHGFITDVSERRQAEARTHQLAHFDALTGLPNRRLLIERIGQSLAAARRQGQTGALLFVDLDNFKQINDARGHSVGDRLLRQVAARLSAELRADDTVARLGGDEFVVLAGRLGTDMESAARHARAVADKLRELLMRPCEIDGAFYGSTGSIGITLFPKAAESVDDLLREADIAMYRAKEAGRNRVAFFEAAMQSEVEERLSLEQDLQQAITAGRIDAHLQPQFDARGREIGGELLLRWHDPVRGPVSPAHFIPVAEETGLILPLGDIVLRRACEALASLHAAGRPLHLSVNVSPRQFRKDDFVERVRELLRETGAPPRGLILEVTEGLLIENWESTLARMQELVALGVRFSIDDFGTGYSSLGYLKRLPLYELKIDKSFVADTPGDPSDTAIVQSILSVARHLGLHVVAEGVETRAQADFLIANGCNSLQGYLLGRPQPLADWLARQVQVLPLAAD